MSGVAIFIFVAIALAGVIFLLVKAAQAAAERERQRLAALSAWASLNGFLYQPRDPWNLDARYKGINDIGRGHDRYAYEVLHRTEPVPAYLFRYHYKTWETRTVTDSKGRTRTERYEATHWSRYLMVELNARFPNFSIRPEGFFDRIAGFIGFDDIDFESEQFSKQYHVKSADKQFAYAIIHPQMMEWMMGPATGIAAELERGMLVMQLPTTEHTAQGCHRAWNLAAGLINRIPPFVWQDYRGEPVTLPHTQPLVTALPADQK